MDTPGQRGTDTYCKRYKAVGEHDHESITCGNLVDPKTGGIIEGGAYKQ